MAFSLRDPRSSFLAVSSDDVQQVMKQVQENALLMKCARDEMLELKVDSDQQVSLKEFLDRRDLEREPILAEVIAKSLQCLSKELVRSQRKSDFIQWTGIVLSFATSVVAIGISLVALLVSLQWM
jgi:hypothetical protein